MWAIEPRVYENVPGRKKEFGRKSKLKKALYEMLDAANIDVYECIMVWRGNVLVRRIVNYWKEMAIIKAFPEYPIARIDFENLKSVNAPESFNPFEL